MVTQGKTAFPPAPALKICGLTTVADAAYCLLAGAEYVGFNFYRGSKRHIEPEAAAAVWAKARAAAPASRARAVAVFVDPTDAEVGSALRDFPEIGVLQFHGAETPSDLTRLEPVLGKARQAWKAIGVRGGDDVARAGSFAGLASLVLFDAPGDAVDVGGTGRRFSWKLIASCPEDLSVGIAGGIRPGMLGELKESLGRRIPSLIDVCSGVETRPGIKDLPAITALVTELRRVAWGALPMVLAALLVGVLGLASTLASAQGAASEDAPAPAADESILPKFDVSATELLTHPDMHRWERHVRGFRREHNFALSAGVSSGSWSVQWAGEEAPRRYENTGIFTRFQYGFHLQLYKGFGYILGSGTGYLYESVDRRRSFRPVSALQYPGLLAGLTLNVNPVVRFSAAFEAYLERHTGIEGRTTTGEDREIFVTLQAYDLGLYTDVFYDLSWALRIEGHIRHVEFLKPEIKSGSYPVDARLHKNDRWLGVGLVYHLL